MFIFKKIIIPFSCMLLSLSLFKCVSLTFDDFQEIWPLTILFLLIALLCFIFCSVPSLIEFYSNFGKTGLVLLLLLLTLLWFTVPIFVYAFIFSGSWVIIILDYQLKGINFLNWKERS